MSTETSAPPVPELPKFAEECRALLAKWDGGESIHTLEMGGLGPSYEQCIQVMAVEFTRAAIDLPLEGTKEERSEVFRESCERTLKPINEKLGGVSGAQFFASKWLAYQWLHVRGPDGVREEAKKQGEPERLILASNFWPSVAAA